MSNHLQGRRIAFLATDGVERVELQQPRSAVEDMGARSELLSLDNGEIALRDHDLEPAGTAPVDRLVADAGIDEFDALVLPGGTVNADKLRLDEQAVAFVGDFVRSGKPVAAICHAPWTLIEADVVRDRTLTSYPSLRTDLRNAGATVVDQQVCIDGNLITSRSPADLDAFCQAIADRFADTPART